MRNFLKFMVPYVKEQKKSFFILNILFFFAAIQQTLVPIEIQVIIDNGILNKDSQVIFYGFIIVFFLAIAELILNISMRVETTYFSQKAMESMRRDIFRAIQGQELQFFAKETVGQLMSRSIDEIYGFQDILTWGIRTAGVIVWLFVDIFITMWFSSIILAFTFSLIIPILFLILIRSSRHNAKIFYNTRFKYGELNQAIAENLSGIRTVKSFGREKEQIKSFSVRNTIYSDEAINQTRVSSGLQPEMIFIISLAMIMLLFFGGILNELNVIKIGQLIAFMLLVIQISNPGRFLGDLAIYIQTADASAIRLNEVIKSKPIIEDEIGAEEIKDIQGDIIFENVSFQYPGSKIYALKNINLHIRAGEKIALLGPTGAGKTTLVNLLPRFFDPTEGKIFLDGKDISTVQLKSLRKYVGIVHQDNFLFTLTLHNNIAFGKITASRNEVVGSAQDAQIHDYISTLPTGYESIVGERGVTLSGGQRQRVTIARTLITLPNVLILDDSVSAVDPETEARLQETLEKVVVSRTTIIITQRPSSLRFVDRILVLDNGEIIQQGTHNELKSQPGMYQDFINAIENQIKFIDWREYEPKSHQIPSTTLPSIKFDNN